jgi:hypothetical protein
VGDRDMDVRLFALPACLPLPLPASTRPRMDVDSGLLISAQGLSTLCPLLPPDRFVGSRQLKDSRCPDGPAFLTAAFKLEFVRYISCVLEEQCSCVEIASRPTGIVVRPLFKLFARRTT